MSTAGSNGYFPTSVGSGGLFGVRFFDGSGPSLVPDLVPDSSPQSSLKREPKKDPKKNPEIETLANLVEQKSRHSRASERL